MADRWFTLTCDDDGHAYVVPSDKVDEFDNWVESESWDVPDYATEVGRDIEFKEWRVME